MTVSVVTSVIILCSLSEEQGDDNFPAIDFVNGWLEAEHYGKLTHLNGHEGGNKAWQQDVFGGAFNYLDAEAFVARLRAAPWERPDCIQIAINGEQGEGWKFFCLNTKHERHFTDTNQYEKLFGECSVCSTL